MSEPDPADRTAEKLAFFGTITASLSHELKNVLATINELSGLVNDLIELAAQGKPLKVERLQSIAQKMGWQVERGEALIRSLNRFAHSADEPRRTADVVELLGQITGLSTRFANLAQVGLACAPAAAPVNLRLDPFAFQQAVFIAIRVMLDAATERRSVQLSVRPTADACTVVVQSGDPVDPAFTASEAYRELARMIDEMGGELKLLNEEAGSALVLTFR